jgi:hypothetical protein
VNAYPGQAAADKKAKADLIHMAFGTRSWTAVESLDSKRLRPPAKGRVGARSWQIGSLARERSNGL